MNCCIQKYTTHHFTYLIYYSSQDKFKNSKIIKIQQVHQKLSTKQIWIFGKIVFYFVFDLNLKQLRFEFEATQINILMSPVRL